MEIVTSSEAGWRGVDLRPMTEGERRALAEMLAAPGVLNQMARASELRIVFCNKCVTSKLWSPVMDGSDCEVCGYRLDLYGPFDEKPTWAPTPKSLPRVWWAGDKPRDLQEAATAIQSEA